ncbi:Transcriptional regulator, TetR family [[Actinomadura] parvosata subsp. kistnae]|uniref:TetR family transcriptional regulator n=1 Tax=[Actinomadura] parvosata subsp. kistnae TaxID=1909395 RepID=A0A1U9ZX72_9ACTN|nr:TetR/AcrR family transcriptional regulator [Nonomuraea sp. ATCC 55076]AQZ62555.1 TetR family transcriptional regulator [Nonomuraea sp. ATCC 55076]SPL88827.1 Transcriptional regulator, TetR family [Actinomadura parvosata subsp. kistnae]
MSTRTSPRRADYAALTRQAIIDAARTLFAERGFFRTKIDEIAELANVAPGTVYAVGGGKQGLLGIMVDEWASAPLLKESLERLPALRDCHEILALVASASRQVREDHGAVMRILLNAAPHDDTAAQGLRESTERYRGTLAAVAERMHELGGLPDGVDIRRATDILWFYFGYSGYFTLTDDNGWSLPEAEQWLLARCEQALLLRPAS